MSYDNDPGHAPIFQQQQRHIVVQQQTQQAQQAQQDQPEQAEPPEQMEQQQIPKTTREEAIFWAGIVAVTLTLFLS
jgi:hypothetical protein